MLLNYLYKHFLEESRFAEATGVTQAALNTLIRSRVFPAASYILESRGHCRSFVAHAAENATYRFHLRGHTDWHRDLLQLGLETEVTARAYFFQRYNIAKDGFLTNPLGQDLITAHPQVIGRFDADHAASTWDHFLNGVYGVCTRDGRPEAVFLKQAGVMFIEEMTANGSDALSPDQLALLERAVALLDRVESDFAPHEVEFASRQRCIVDVRRQYFGGLGA
ncbi:MAG: DUF6058 family natural product biosynthesis protein [Pseudomonadota bacterium]